MMMLGANDAAVSSNFNANFNSNANANSSATNRSLKQEQKEVQGEVEVKEEEKNRGVVAQLCHSLNVFAARYCMEEKEEEDGHDNKEPQSAQQQILLAEMRAALRTRLLAQEGIHHPQQQQRQRKKKKRIATALLRQMHIHLPNPNFNANHDRVHRCTEEEEEQQEKEQQDNGKDNDKTSHKHSPRKNRTTRSRRLLYLLRKGVQDVILEACGVSTVLMAAMEVVSALANTAHTATATPNADTDADTDADACALDAAGSMIRRVVIQSEEHLIALLLGLYSEVVVKRDKDNDDDCQQQEEEEESHSCEESRQYDSSQFQVFLHRWTSQLIRFHRVIANAYCVGGNSRRGRFAGGGGKGESHSWEARLVACAVRAAALMVEEDHDHDAATPHRKKIRKVVIQQYIHALLHALLPRPGKSGAESIAVGINNSPSLAAMRMMVEALQLQSTNTAITTTTTLTPTTTADNDLSAAAAFSFSSSFSFPPRPLASLCSTLVLLWLSNINHTKNHNKKNKEDDGNDKRLPPSYMMELLIPILSSRVEIQDIWVHDLLLLPPSTTPALIPTNSVRTLHHHYPPVKERVVVHLLMHLPTTRACNHNAMLDHDDSDDAENKDKEGIVESTSSTSTTTSSSASSFSWPLLRQVHRIAALWGADMNDHRCGIGHSQQHSWTQFLLAALERLAQKRKTLFSDLSTSHDDDDDDDDDDTNTTDTTLMTLLQGVSDRLHSTNPLIRRDGMLIGQAISQHVLVPHTEPGDDIKAVVFDELLEQDQEWFTTNAASEDDRQDVSHSKLNKKKQQHRRTRIADPDDTPYVSDCENSTGSNAGSSSSSYSSSSSASAAAAASIAASVYSDDSEWFGLEPIQPYNVQDDEDDLRDTAVPLYLSECLDLLRTSVETNDNAFSAHQAALEALPNLVRDRPADLPDVGPMLARQLVNMENKFQMQRFDENVLESLCALVVEEPVSIGHVLVDDIIFRDGESFHSRVLALSALNDAAWELSENKRLQLEPSPSSSTISFARSNQRLLRMPLDGEQRVFFRKRHIVSSTSDDTKTIMSIESKTRRWKSARGALHDHKPREFTNRFSHVAPAWFYALVHTFWDRAEDATLWSGHVGSLLLAHMLQSLTIIVECCGTTTTTSSASTQMLAHDLIRLVWKFRDADIPEVRASVLCAVGTSLSVLSQESMLSVLLVRDYDFDVPLYIQCASSTDPDPQCRALAERIAATVSESVQQQQQLQHSLLGGELIIK